jgi:hypothetical protein
MSVQTNQYLIYGLRMPYKWHEQYEKEHNINDFYTHFEKFIDDSAFDNKIVHHEGIFCLFDGCSGKYIIIGRVLEKSKDGEFIADGEPVEIFELTDLEKEFIEISVKRNFEIEGDFNYYLVTQYR